MPIGYNPDRADVAESYYGSQVLSVTTTEIEAKVGPTRNTLRQILVIRNYGPGTIYYGPQGVLPEGNPTEGLPLVPNQEVSFPAGDIGVFLIHQNATSKVVIQEFG